MKDNGNDDNREAAAQRPLPDNSTHQPSSALPWKLKGADFSNAWAVDAACSGNPGPMEYRGIDLDTGERIFHFGPVYGTNNIGEFLAIVHALALMKQKGIRKTIFSNSFTAQTWIKKRHCKTQLERNEKTEPLFALIDKAHKWLRINAVEVPILTWDTKKYGDIPEGTKPNSEANETGVHPYCLKGHQESDDIAGHRSSQADVTMNNNGNDDNRAAQRPMPDTSANKPSLALPWKLKGADFSNAWAVDAACSGNPGPMEYQGIDLDTGERIFHFGPVYGTNNIGEFLAIVHALALMKQKGIRKTIFSDSFTAQTWIKKRHCKTQLERNEKTKPLFDIIDSAHNWLRINAIEVPILAWDTKKYGDIPADFGRK